MAEKVTTFPCYADMPTGPWTNYCEAVKAERRLRKAGYVCHLYPVDGIDDAGLCYREWRLAPGHCPPMPPGGDLNDLLDQQVAIFGYDRRSFLRRQYR